MDKAKILIVDDDDDVRMQMKWALAPHYDVTLAEDRTSALEALQRNKPQAVTLDLGLPPSPRDTREGLLTLENMLQFDPLLKVLVVTGQDEKANGIEAIKQGAYDFFAKPIDIDELKVVLDRALYVQQLEREGTEVRETADITSFEGIIGNSSQIQAVFGTIQKVSSTDASVLIVGESGTGKELVARAIHRRSPRKTGPFVAINCGAIPESLLESELFGHEKGAFTGAHMQRRGRIETAQGGTLFLDEIGDLSVPLQVKLLRFLQEQCIERVGGRQPIQVDTRIVAATNGELKKAIVEGRFREDLYYRLAVVVINLPPLRERENDVRVLASEFLRRAAAKVGKNGLAFDHDALRALNSHSWPGNVRELVNRVKRAVIMADGKRLTVEDLELGELGGMPRATTLKEAREALEREMIQKMLRKYSGKIAPAAAELGVSRPTLYELMDKLGLKRE